MDFLLLGIVVVLATSLVYGQPFWRAGRVYLYLRKRRERICPETDRPVSVQLDALHAARTMLTRGVADLQVKDCTRWPSRRGCEQSCLSMFQPVKTAGARESEPAHFHRQGA